MAKTSIPPRKGAYTLILAYNGETKKPVQAGSKITLELEPNRILIYIGSAHGPGGLKARITRHLKKTKKKHWHIDYLTTRDDITIIGVIYVESKDRNIESCLATTCAKKLQPAAKGFGSTDDRGSLTHLFQAYSIEEAFRVARECFRSCLPEKPPQVFSL